MRESEQEIRELWFLQRLFKSHSAGFPKEIIRDGYRAGNDSSNFEFMQWHDKNV